MIGLVVFISMSLLAVCQANVAVAPPAPVQCDAAIPTGVSSCLDTPQLIKPEVTGPCPDDDCENLSCTYRKSGWLDGDKVDRPKLIAYYDQIAKENPQWQAVVDHLKTACLQGDLPAQGIYLNCPAYDTAQCIFESFVRKAQPSQWPSTEECQIARQYVAACPFCPPSCNTTEKPVGSCNACNPLPRSL